MPLIFRVAKNSVNYMDKKLKRQQLTSATYVTQPYLPELSEILRYLETAWKTKRLTNKGALHDELEEKLVQYLNVDFLSLCSNGTLALMIALKALGVCGKVITTPYSFVATSHVLNWIGLEPVFVDIDPKTYNIDPEKIEAAITSDVSAILPVHVYGTPCDVHAIQEIAGRHGLKIIYDAAHAFGVRLNNQSILTFGDLSALSFHATKVFSTCEGGAIISHNTKMKKMLEGLANFGIQDEVTVSGIGINAKLSELHAAFGLSQLKYTASLIRRRKEIDLIYREILEDLPGVTVPQRSKSVQCNYSYFPVFIDTNGYGRSRNELYEHLRRNRIYCRRYFYPLISHFEPYKNLTSASSANLPIAEKAARQVLCLPIYPTLDKRTASKIAMLINSFKG